MRKVAQAAFCLLAAALVAPSAWATTAVERTEGELIQEAQVIVTGRCIKLQPTWIERDLVTLATIEVSEVLKGNPGATIEVVLPGGIDTNRPVPVAMTFPAAPEIFMAENVLLFLIAEDRVVNGFAVAGFSQGKLTVVEDAQGKSIATQNLSSLNLQNKQGGITRGTTKAISLDALRHKIKESNHAQ
jgi:hypothetical protein